MEDKPCPFCMSEDLSFLEGDDPISGDFVVCDDCFAEGPKAPSDELAYAWWNRRNDDHDGCPFCGSEVKRMDEFIECAVECNDCRAKGPTAPSGSIALERWVSRGAPQ